MCVGISKGRMRRKRELAEWLVAGVGGKQRERKIFRTTASWHELLITQEFSYSHNTKKAIRHKALSLFWRAARDSNS